MNSQSKCEKLKRETGFVIGREWAQGHARPEELERLQFAIEEDATRPWYESIFDDSMPSNCSASEAIVSIIFDLDDVDGDDASEFWGIVAADVDPDIIHHCEFARGFADGALEAGRHDNTME